MIYLLLGPSSAGKSTVLKQLKLRYTKNGLNADRQIFSPTLQKNLIASLSKVVNAMFKWEILPSNEKLKESLEHFRKIQMIENVIQVHNQFLLDFIPQVLKNEEFNRVFSRGNEFNLYDSAQYFFDNYQRFLSDQFLPNDDDILRARLTTMGVQELEFTETDKHHSLMVYDIGGRRHQRAKWASFFDQINAILFVASLSCYDQVLDEDETTNQMIDAIDLYKKTVNHPSLVKTPVILFLNKIDIFEKKYNSNPIVKYFPEYKSDSKDYKKGIEFFESKFKKLNATSDRQVYIYHTHATDSKQMHVLFTSLIDVIVNTKLKSTGIY